MIYTPLVGNVKVELGCSLKIILPYTSNTLQCVAELGGFVLLKVIGVRAVIHVGEEVMVHCPLALEVDSANMIIINIL